MFKPFEVNGLNIQAYYFPSSTSSPVLPPWMLPLFLPAPWPSPGSFYFWLLPFLFHFPCVHFSDHPLSRGFYFTHYSAIIHFCFTNDSIRIDSMSVLVGPVIIAP